MALLGDCVVSLGWKLVLAVLVCLCGFGGVAPRFWGFVWVGWFSWV